MSGSEDLASHSETVRKSAVGLIFANWEELANFKRNMLSVDSVLHIKA